MNKGNFFLKFKEDTKFKYLVEQFKINKSTKIFKINIVKLVDKSPKVLISSVALNFSKSYYKDAKNICKKTPELFLFFKNVFIYLYFFYHYCCYYYYDYYHHFFYFIIIIIVIIIITIIIIIIIIITIVMQVSKL